MWWLSTAIPNPAGSITNNFRRILSGKHKKLPNKRASFLVTMLESTPVEILSNTLVWGVFPAPQGEGWLLNLYGEDAPKQILTHSLILATGAYDTPIPFPGWTLPGVMTAGAGQIFIKESARYPREKGLADRNGPASACPGFFFDSCRCGSGVRVGGFCSLPESF